MTHADRNLILIFALLCASATIAAEPLLEKIDLFQGNQDGYALYRIPGIIVTHPGTVLAYCEARRTGKSDWDTIDIMLRRSTDGGKTWEPRRKIADVPGPKTKNPVALAKKLADANDVTYNNPVAIADRNGTIHFLFCLEYARCFWMHSEDDGRTFSNPVEITKTFEQFRKDYPWKVLATGPGHGIQLKSGRLIVPVWLSPGTGGHAHRPSVTSTIFSDDHGRTWQRGDIAVPDTSEWIFPNETIAVELADGRVLLNVRSESKRHRRILVTSHDGATDWSTPRYDDALLEPICMASMVRYSLAPPSDKNRILFANPHNLERADGKGQAGISRDRRNLSVKLSDDDGASWRVNKVLEPGYSAYSDMAVLPDGTVLCLYERGRNSDAERKKPTSYAYLTLARFSLEWLTQEQPAARSVETTPIGSLLDRLPEMVQKDMDGLYYSSRTGFWAITYSETKEPGAADILRRIIASGAAAIPDLMAHLDDERKTNIKVTKNSEHGKMIYIDEYDYNRRTAKTPPTEVNRPRLPDNEKTPDEHTVTVGDLCFVALGQIVNRQFNAIRTDYPYDFFINSPTSSQRLRNAIRQEWNGVTKDQHKQSLIRDFKEPDVGLRRRGAVIRIGYYYPEELDSLVVEQLTKLPFGTVVEQLVREKLYAAQNAAERKAHWDAFLVNGGEPARQEVLIYLFGNLAVQETIDGGAIFSPPLNPSPKARECLVELFGYPKEVKSSDKPLIAPEDDSAQTLLIDTVSRFPSPKIDEAVKKVMHSTEVDYLARACARYLACRGADNEIRAYVEKRMPMADELGKVRLDWMIDHIGWTPLHAAAARYDDAQLEELLSKGADVNAQAANGRTALHVAVRYHSMLALSVLIKRKADVNLRDKQGKTAIQYSLGDKMATGLLVDAGAEIPDLYVAAFIGRDDLVKAFLEKDQSLANRRSEQGETALHYAVQRGHLRAAELLIEAGADVNAFEHDRAKRTPLHLAAANGHRELVALLLKSNADRKAVDARGKTPLIHATERSHLEIMKLLHSP